MLQAGLRKAFDFSTTVGFMEAGGWRLPKFAALMVTAAETLGGIGLLLGVLTPLAACAVVAAMIDAWAVNVSAAAFWSEPFNVAVPDRARRRGAALHRRRRLLGRRRSLRPDGLVGQGCVRVADPGDRGRDA